MQLGYLRSRVARRLFALFIACALIPVCVVVMLATHELSALSDRRTDERLGDISKTYGMAFIGRLLAAEDVLRAIAGNSRNPTHVAPDEAAIRHVLVDVREVPSQASSDATRGDHELPSPSAPQQQALARGGSVVLLKRHATGPPTAFVIRQTVRGTLVVGEISRDSLWPDQEDLPDKVRLVVLDSDLAPLFGTVPLPSEAALAATNAIRRSTRRDGASRSFSWIEASGTHRAQYWEVFLQSHFRTPSLYVIAYAPATPLYAEVGSFRVLFPATLALIVVLTLWLSISQIRRQIRPLEDLIDGTRRLARRDFTAVVGATSEDEFGELARSFNDMSGSLHRQFTALEAMAEIDRLLLQSPDLESVLDLLLPRVARSVGARTVSVMLLDPDTSSRARLYDCIADRADVLPVRRVTTDARALQAAAEHSPVSVSASASAFERFGFLRPLATLGATIFDLHIVRLGERIAGILCIGFGDAQPATELAAQARDFADRLGVVLANLDHEARLFRQAHFDPLTGLPNRELLLARISEAAQRAVENDGRGALLYIDLDQFKRVNDISGHKVGDDLLQIVAQRLVASVKDGDTVARLGGDEFAVVLTQISDQQVALAVCTRILTTLAKPITVGGRDQYISASIGITVFPDHGRTVTELLTHSDVAMYRAKDAGRGRAVFFEPQMHARMLARASLDSDLHEALRLRQFLLHYQPIVRSKGRTLAACEALVRWSISAAGVVRSPAEFIPAAEENGLIVELGDWVLETAIRDFAAWRRLGLSLSYVSVNVSPRQLRERAFVQRLQELLATNAVRPQSILIEITETVLGDGPETLDALRRLAAVGVRIGLDDFGTGYSSLSYLRNLPIDCIKIDRSFIEEVPAVDSACKLVETILLMGKSLDKVVIAEGVESQAQLEFLVSHGCNLLQGFLTGRPMPAHELLRLGQSDGETPVLRSAS